MRADGGANLMAGERGGGGRSDAGDEVSCCPAVSEETFRWRSVETSWLHVNSGKALRRVHGAG